MCIIIFGVPICIDNQAIVLFLSAVFGFSASLRLWWKSHKK